MPNYTGSPVGNSGNITVSCTREGCKGKSPLIRYIDQMVILKPRPPYYNETMLDRTTRIWYCCHCNQKLAESETKHLKHVVGIDDAQLDAVGGKL